MTNATGLSGKCLCGTIRVSVRETPPQVAACHCSMCRRWSGGPLLAVNCGTGVTFQGAEHITSFASSDWAERGFCARCGTHLFYRLKADGSYFLPAGLLEEGPAWALSEQIFIDEKPIWYEFANETKNLTGAEVFAAFAPPGD